jgi:translation initiation factor IF-2
VNADGLLAVIEKKAQGEEVSAEDVVEVQVRAFFSAGLSFLLSAYALCAFLALFPPQREVQKQKQLQRAQKDVQRVLQNASESENKLGVALKVSRSGALHALHSALILLSYLVRQIEQAKRQQALQNRLLNKKKKSE